MSLPHTQKRPQGGAGRLIGTDLLQLEAPPPPPREVTGASPIPPLPNPREENPGTGNGGRGRGSREKQVFVFLQSEPKSAQNLDRGLSECPVRGGGCGGTRYTAPSFQETEGPPVSRTRKCTPRSSWRAGGLRRVRAAPRPPPGAPLPRPGAGPLSRTWSPPGHRARHTPSPPTAARPRGGQAGSAPSPPPRGRGPETRVWAGYRRSPES